MKLFYSKNCSDYVFPFRFMQCGIEFEEAGDDFILYENEIKHTGFLSIFTFFAKLNNSVYISEDTNEAVALINNKNPNKLLKHTKSNKIIPNDLQFEDVYLFTKVYRAIYEGTYFNRNELEYFNRLMEKVETKIKIKKKNDFDYLDIRVGRVIAIKEHESADKLYIETVLFEEGKHLQILSGLRNFFSKEDLINKSFLFMLNLKESVLKGVKSQGMILCVMTSEGFEPLKAPLNSAEGTIACLNNCDTGVEVILNFKKKFYDKNNAFYQSLMQKLNVKGNRFCFGEDNITVDNQPIITVASEGDVI
ncbi:hypothetical protein COBT_001395 [Conglomerata obtusa]